MSASAPPPARYSSAAIALHWLLALLLMFQLSLGWRLETLHGVPQFTAFQLHKSIGISILVLSLARLAIRLMVRRPAPFPQPPALAFLASAVHILLYVVMIGGPITGWIIVSTAKIKVPTLIFGTLPWPHLPVGPGWHDPAAAAHSLIGWLLVGLVLLHVAGALKHHIARDDLIGRMIPVRGWGGLGVAAGVAILALLGAMALAKMISFGAPVVAPPTTALAANEAAGPNEADALAPVAPNAAEPAANEAAATNEAAAGADAKAAVPWRVEAGGQLGFKADYSGTAVEGSFKRWTADIIFSPDDLDHSRIGVSVDLASVDTADSERDDNLKGDGFFDIAAHPRATFRSTRITHRGGNAYRAAGTLSLHGVQQPITLDFTLDIKDDVANAAGTAPLSRTAFKVGTGQWEDTGTIADAVGIHFRLKARRTK